MGLDLRLLPYDHDAGNFAFSHTVLFCDRSGELFDALIELEKTRGRAVIKEFTSFSSQADDKCEETHYGVTTETPYGEPLQELEVETLLVFRDHPDVTSTWRNRAVWAYLSHLPARTKVALFWH